MDPNFLETWIKIIVFLQKMCPLFVLQILLGSGNSFLITFPFVEWFVGSSSLPQHFCLQHFFCLITLRHHICTPQYFWNLWNILVVPLNHKLIKSMNFFFFISFRNCWKISIYLKYWFYVEEYCIANNRITISYPLYVVFLCRIYEVNTSNYR